MRSGPRLRYSGLGIAVLGFASTRLLVAETLEADAASFMVAGLLPLAAGLGLTAYGMAVAVGAFRPAYARSVWVWSALGTFAMGLVLTTTAAHSVLIGEGFDPLLDSGPLVANSLLGGAIGGAVVGHLSAANRHEREELARYAERTMLVNRLLRHEILDATKVVKGYTGAIEDEDDGGDGPAAIRESTEHIEQTIEGVSAFAATDGSLSPVDLHEVVESVVADVADEPGVATDHDVPPDTLVRADERLEILLRELVENAIQHAGPDPSVEVAARTDHRTATVTVRDDGPGLPDTAREVLSARSLPEYDDPNRGYGLQMVRLLIEHYGGTLRVAEDDGTTITVTLQRTTEEGAPPLALGVPRADLFRATAAALVAGIVSAGLLQVAGGVMPTIGALYSVESAVVGWVAYLFHSIVFGLVFAAACATDRLRSLAASARTRVGLGIAWGVTLWAVGAGVIMPVWLMAVGLPTELPNLDALSLASHVVWGALLGWLSGVLPAPGRLTD